MLSLHQYALAQCVKSVVAYLFWALDFSADCDVFINAFKERIADSALAFNENVKLRELFKRLFINVSRSERYYAVAD